MINNSLSKSYDNGKNAVNKFNLVIEEGDVFGLLGPNGAGKTTFFSMITGVFAPSSGEAFVAGYSIKNDMEKVHLHMGVCPQFDILWPTLTVQDHLYFYGRLKGVPSDNLDESVRNAI